eukprot:Gb_27644 [translate_table: standard]
MAQNLVDHARGFMKLPLTPQPKVFSESNLKPFGLDPRTLILHKIGPPPPDRFTIFFRWMDDVISRSESYIRPQEKARFFRNKSFCDRPAGSDFRVDSLTGTQPRSIGAAQALWNRNSNTEKRSGQVPSRTNPLDVPRTILTRVKSGWNAGCLSTWRSLTYTKFRRR